GFDFFEPMLRNTCAGISSGLLEVNVGPRSGASATDFQTACLRVWNGGVATSGTANATTAGGSFSSGPQISSPDAVELVYGNARAYTRAVDTPATGVNPVIKVADATGFKNNDYVLLTNDYVTAVLTGPVTVDTTTTPHQITVSSLSAALDQASNPSSLVDTLQPTWVMIASTVAFFVDTSDPANPVLKFDPDGVAGPTHNDAIPLLDGVEDLQIAVANDGRTCAGCVSCNGIAEGTGATAPDDEWIGNDPSTNEVPLPAPSPGVPWVPAVCAAGSPRLLSIRVTLLVRTLNSYAGATYAPVQLEDRTTYASATGPAPRRRVLQLEVQPREWN